MNFNDQLALTVRLAVRGNLRNWRAYAALAGMLVMLGGMVLMMWLLSQPGTDLRGFACGAASVAGLSLWRAMLPGAANQDARNEAGRRNPR